MIKAQTIFITAKILQPNKSVVMIIKYPQKWKISGKLTKTKNCSSFVSGKDRR